MRLFQGHALPQRLALCAHDAAHSQHDEQSLIRKTWGSSPATPSCTVGTTPVPRPRTPTPPTRLRVRQPRLQQAGAALSMHQLELQRLLRPL